MIRRSKHCEKLIDFICFLKNDLLAYCHQIFKQMMYVESNKYGVNQVQYNDIMKLRCHGYTLQEIGDKYNYSRERIRQIENNYIDRFRTFYSKISRFGIFRIVLGSEYCYTVKDIKRIFGKDFEFYIYLFKKLFDNEIIIFDNGIICDNSVKNWYNYAKDYIQSMPKMFNKRNINKYVREIDAVLDNYGVTIKESLIKGIISNTYKLNGIFYCRSDVSIRDKCVFILEKHYTKGIRIYDEAEIENFLHIYEQTFGPYELSTNCHAVQSTLNRFTILCDKDKYKVKDDILISQELLNDICKYIDSNSKPFVFTGAIYYAFKKRLKEEGIKNICHLYGILRELLANRYYFNRKSKSRIVKITLKNINSLT